MKQAFFYCDFAHKHKKHNPQQNTNTSCDLLQTPKNLKIKN